MCVHNIFSFSHSSSHLILAIHISSDDLGLMECDLMYACQKTPNPNKTTRSELVGGDCDGKWRVRRWVSTFTSPDHNRTLHNTHSLSKFNHQLPLFPDKLWLINHAIVRRFAWREKNNFLWTYSTKYKHMQTTSSFCYWALGILSELSRLIT
jgi:hypothetical protein